MNYPEYAADLQHIHESEVYGRAVFSTAARLTLNPSRKKKWLALKALEEQTLERYLAYMQQTGQTVKEPRGWATKGAAEGAALAVMPWRLAMRLVRDATQPFQEKFLRLKNHAEEADQAFFNYVYAHEKAIEAFAARELERSGNSTQAIEKLLGSEQKPQSS